MSMRPALALEVTEVAQDLADQGVAEEDRAEEDRAEEDRAEEDKAEEERVEDDALVNGNRTQEPEQSLEGYK
ncbi:MAG: hypothetical protein ISR63_10145 [Desulfobacterales bacterium]|nr:hypothetical protein [Desulfobacterales bacterium]